MDLKIPQQCAYILRRYKQAGFAAYLVGGCVRDRLLNKEPKDWDICTAALPEETCRLFAEEKIIMTGLKHGTVTLLINSLPVEVTTFRIDGEYEDHRHPKEVFFTDSLREDLSRRDFTINALAYHPDEGLVDFFQGREDLAHGIIRCVGDAASRYQEDGLRIMRAVRFACVLNFTYEEGTRKAIQQYNYLLDNIAAERIQAELNRILVSPYASRGLRDLAELNCFPYFMPMLCHTYDFVQEGGTHLYDVFTHTLKSVDFITPKLILRLTMLLHDIGKPFVWQSGEQDSFPFHELVGADIAEKILQDLRYDRATIQEVTKLISHHVMVLLDEPKNIRYALSRLGEFSLRNLLQVKIADMQAHNDQFGEVIEKFHQMETILDEIITSGQCYSLKQLAVNGRDLAALGYKGAAIGAELNRLLGLVLEEPSRNRHEELLREAQASLNKYSESACLKESP